MEHIGAEDAISLLVRLDQWSKSKEVQPGEMGRLIAIILALIVVSYAILAVARIVAALALPTLVIVVLLLIYRFVSLGEMGDGLKELPSMLDSLKHFFTGFMQKADGI